MSKPDKKLFLLDAYALIYRAHFAFSQTPRISSKGLNTSVMLGFTNTMLEVLQKQKPSHIAVVFDTSAPTFRHVQYPEYKANREETPEDIRIAVPIVKDIIRAFNIPVIEKDGFEADDIIGTLAKKAARQGFEVFMMTPDKDFGQLVEEHIYLYKPAFMGNAVDIMGIDDILKKWDIDRIDQVVDMLGLQGDAVDNIPGIPGVGPKTASKFLKEYGSVEGLLENTDKLKGKMKEKVVEFAQQGLMSKELARINIEVPVDFDEKALEYSGADEEKLKPIFEELEFRTLLRRVFNTEPATVTGGAVASTSGQLDMFSAESKSAINLDETPPVKMETIKTVEHNYQLIDSEELRKSLIGYLKVQDEFCFDTETTGIDAVEADVVGIAFSYFKGDAYYVPVPDNFDDAKKLYRNLPKFLVIKRFLK
jgi:DNA polymerase I